MAASQVAARLVRMWAILDRMQTRARGITAGQLEEALGISHATLYRDLKLLCESPLPIRKETVTGETRYRLEADGWSLPRPSPRQALALALARRFLNPLEGTRLVREVDDFLALAGGAPSLPVAASAAPPMETPAHTRALERAIEDHLRVRLRYAGAARPENSRVVEPVELRLHGDHVYVMAGDVQKREWRVFKVPRIKEVTLLEEKSTEHPPYDPDAEFAHSLGIWSGKPERVRVRLTKEKARLAGEYPLGTNTRVVPQPDGSVVVEGTVAGVVEARGWVLRWGKHAEVLAPVGLREMVAEELRAAAVVYAETGCLTQGELSGRYG